MSNGSKYFLWLASCGGLALTLSLLYRDYPVKRAVPPLFALVLVITNYFFGRTTSLVVAAIGVLVFAEFLFGPYGSLIVSGTTDRITLIFFGLVALVLICVSPTPTR